MAFPKLSDEIAEQTARLYREHNCNVAAAARSTKIHVETLRSRLKVAAERGYLLDTPAAMPGFRISRVAEGTRGKTVEQRPELGAAFQVPAGHRVKAVSAFVDPEGREIAKWIKTKEGELDPLELAEALKGKFQDWTPSPPLVPEPGDQLSDYCTIYPLADLHIGLRVWKEESEEDWDLKIAERVIGTAMDNCVSQSPASSLAIVLGGGDLLHADTQDNKTLRSGHVLQVDGRYQKTTLAAATLMVRMVDNALRRHKRVIVRLLPGNHDEHSSVAVTYFLHAWFRNEPRVEIDTDPSLFWWHRFGKVLLGATHGHTVKLDQMPGIMAHRRAQDWGLTRYRYVHGFHLHRAEKIATEGHGVLCEIHQTPIPKDAWAFGSGYLSGRSIQSITYHHELGERGRWREPVICNSEEGIIIR